MLDAAPARVVGVVDVPLDEERETVAERRVVSHEVPAELHPVGPRAAHRQRLVAGSPRATASMSSVRRHSAPGPSPTSASRRCTHDPTGLRRRLVAVDDGHQLDVAAAERHDAVARAVPDVTTAGDRRQPELVVVATGRRLEIVDDDDHMVDGQHAAQ